MEALFFILTLFLLYKTLSLSSRISVLEKKLQGKQISPQTETISQSELSKPVTTTVESAYAAKQQVTQKFEQHSDPISESIQNGLSWIKEDWLLKLGALLLLIGFGWFISYAFANNWIGPMGRVTLGFITGVAFLLLGEWRVKKYTVQGGIFLVVGSAFILLTMYAAREIYGFFTPLIALSVMFISAAFVAVSSVRHNREELAIISIILAALAPILTNSPTPDMVTLFLYLLIVTIGSVWIIFFKNWRRLTIVSLVTVFVYSLPVFFGGASADDELKLMLIAFVFAAIYYVTNTFALFRLSGKEALPDLITAAANGLFLVAWIMAVGPEQWQSLLIVAWMLVFSFGAFALVSTTKRYNAFFLYAGIGVAMLATATAIELDGPALTIAYTLEATLLALSVYGIMRNAHVSQAMTILLVGPVALSIESITSNKWRTTVFHDDFVVLFMLGAVLMTLGVIYLALRHEEENLPERKVTRVLISLGSAYFYTLIWLSLHAAFVKDDSATTTALVIYTIIALITYFYGVYNHKSFIRSYGAVLLALVIMRMVFIEVWDMALAGRIITFFSIGALLMITAVLTKKKMTEGNYE